jgi:histone H3/H4
MREGFYSMATNRFKKSIDKATENTTNIVSENTIDNTSDNTIESAVESIVENKSEIYSPANSKTITTDDIIKKLTANAKKNRGRNYTIYLSYDVADALDKFAAKTKRQKSPIIDDILREVLITGRN